MAYGSAAGVRLVNFKITSDLMDDTEVVDVLEADVDPMIDAFLGTTFTSAPALIVSASNELGAAEIVERHLIQDDEESGWAKRIREKWFGRDGLNGIHAPGMLDRIKSGEWSLDGYSGVAAMSASDPTADEPSHRVFINDEKDWGTTSIAREMAT